MHVSSLAGSGVHQFHFRVKFYSSSPCQLREEITRYQFFLQLKSDLQAGTMPSSLYQDIVELSALVLQCKCLGSTWQIVFTTLLIITFGV